MKQSQHALRHTDELLQWHWCRNSTRKNSIRNLTWEDGIHWNFVYFLGSRTFPNEMVLEWQEWQGSLTRLGISRRRSLLSEHVFMVCSVMTKILSNMTRSLHPSWFKILNKEVISVALLPCFWLHRWRNSMESWGF